MDKFKSFLCLFFTYLLVSNMVIGGEKTRQDILYRVLSDCGSVDDKTVAQKTMDICAGELIEKGGGVIVITDKTNKDFVPVNHYQKGRDKNSVFLLDVRKGGLTLYPPQVGFDSRGVWSGFTIKRTLNMLGESLGHWTTTSPLHIENNVVSGSSSVGRRILFDVKAGKDVRVFPANMDGFWIGMVINLSGKNGYDGQFKVKDIGWDQDKKLGYFTADLKHDHKAGDGLMNKHQVPMAVLSNYYNADNQSFNFDVRNHQYGVGDSLGISMLHLYQSNIFSGGGDEGSACYNAEVIHDLDPFRAKVESYNSKTGELVYAPGNTNTSKLSMSRPLVNLNPKKWITDGHVKIVRPDDFSGWLEDGKGGYTDWTGKKTMIAKNIYKGKGYPSIIKNGINVLGGLIEGSKDAPWDESVVGRYFSVNEESERYKPGELGFYGYWPAPKKDLVRRWYRITKFEKRDDGTKRIRILRVRWTSTNSGSPTLFREDNYTRDGHERPLKYIIAPGGLVYDISRGWVDTRKNGGRTVKADSRILKISPNSDTGTPMDFEPEDTVFQAVGPDPWMPKAMRVRVFDEFPSSMESPVILLSNQGSVARSDGVLLGGHQRYTDQLDKRKDRRPLFENGLRTAGLVGTAVRIQGHVTEAAMVMEQVGENKQPIKWLHKGKTGSTSIVADPKTGDLKVDGGALNLDKSALVKAKGISATDKPARNLRGINVHVNKGETVFKVKFDIFEVDNKYAINVLPTWFTQVRIIKKSTVGFTVAFSESAPRRASVDWMMMR